MVDVLSLAAENFLSPTILFFVLGAIAAAVRSDLEIPSAIGKGLSLFLIASIGFTGGVKLSGSAWTSTMIVVGVAAVIFSFVLPVLAYHLLGLVARVKPLDAAAIAASYGSVSAVTFVTAAAFLTAQDVFFAGYLVAVLALMEAPAVVSGLVLARDEAAAVEENGDVARRRASLVPWSAFREAFTSGSVFLLVGALVIGWATGQKGVDAVGSVLISPFQGVLALFLLEMGLIVVRRFKQSRFMGWPLVAFGLYMPLFGAAVALAFAWIVGLGQGDATLLAVLFGSASYIAVPAAFRHALPEADPSKYVTLALGVTFPFNVVIGIPLYYTVAGLILG